MFHLVLSVSNDYLPKQHLTLSCKARKMYLCEVGSKFVIAINMGFMNRGDGTGYALTG
jgi:hypothetical protein